MINEVQQLNKLKLKLNKLFLEWNYEKSGKIKIKTIVELTGIDRKIIAENWREFKDQVKMLNDQHKLQIKVWQDKADMISAKKLNSQLIDRIKVHRTEIKRLQGLIETFLLSEPDYTKFT